MGDAAFVGRYPVLERLEQALAAASNGIPQMIMIRGEPGFGKSALLSTFASRLERPPALTITCDESESMLPLAAIGQVLPATAIHDPFVAGGDLLQTLGRQQDAGTAVLLVDDTHLMDPGSTRALTFALRRLRVDRVLAVLTVRDDEIGRLPASLLRLCEGQGPQLRLPGLDDREVAELAMAVRGIALPARAVTRLREHTDGCPLHLKALLEELSPAELAAVEGPLPAPRSFSLLVLKSLSTASPEAQRLAEAAAVIGDRTDLEVLSQVAAVSDPLPGLEELQHIRVLRFRPRTASWNVQFEHPLVRMAIYDELGAATRRRLHEAAADLLGDAEGLDHRVSAATKPSEDLAVALEHRARERQSSGRLRMAAQDLLVAHKVSPRSERSSGRLVDAVDLLLLSGDITTALTVAAEIEPRTDLHALQIKARMAFLSGRIPLARELAEAVWHEATEAGPKAEMATLLAHLCLLADDGLHGYEWAERALASNGLDVRGSSTALALAAFSSWISGRPAQGLRALQALPDDPTVVPHDQQDEVRARGVLRMCADDLDGAMADLTASTTAQHDVAPFRLAAMACLSETQFRRGDWDGSVATAEQAISLVRDTEQHWLLANVHAVAALVPAARGQWQVAMDHVRRARTSAEQTRDAASVAYSGNAAVHLAMCRRDPNEALHECQSLITFPHESAAWQPGIFSWPVHWVDALVDLGRLDDAVEALATLRDVRTDVDVPSRMYALARVRGRLAVAHGHRAEAREWFETAVSARPDWPDALEFARAQADYGRFLRRRGERKSAIAHLNQAFDALTRLQATPLATTCYAELEAAGSAPRSDARSSGPHLTAQEQSVARLVAAGRTNQQVANELMLSIKTVGFHLEHVYDKLDLHSRSQLAAYYSRTPSPNTAAN